MRNYKELAAVLLPSLVVALAVAILVAALGPVARKTNNHRIHNCLIEQSGIAETDAGGWLVRCHFGPAKSMSQLLERNP